MQNGSLHVPVKAPFSSKSATDCQIYLTDSDLAGGFVVHSYESTDVTPDKRFVSTSHVPP